MIYKIIIKYKSKEELCKVIKIPLDSKIEVLKNGEQIIISLSNCKNDYLFEFKENEVYGYEISKIA